MKDKSRVRFTRHGIQFCHYQAITPTPFLPTCIIKCVSFKQPPSPHQLQYEIICFTTFLFFLFSIFWFITNPHSFDLSYCFFLLDPPLTLSRFLSTNKICFPSWGIIFFCDMYIHIYTIYCLNYMKSSCNKYLIWFEMTHNSK